VEIILVQHQSQPISFHCPSPKLAMVKSTSQGGPVRSGET
jgi:hypothetical protein